MRCQTTASGKQTSVGMKTPKAKQAFAFSILTAYGSDDPDAKQFSAFSPIPELQRSDADVSLVFLSSNTIIFAEEVDDPWYSSRRPGYVIRASNDDSVTKQTNFQDTPAGVLGCTIQEQYCNPNLAKENSCEPLRGLFSRTDSTLTYWQDERQKERFRWLSSIMNAGRVDLDTVLNVLGTSALTSRYSLFGGLQGPRPSDQWQREVENWFNITLTSIQSAFVEATTGPNNPSLDQWRVKPNTTDAMELCWNQVRLSHAFLRVS